MKSSSSPQNPSSSPQNDWTDMTDNTEDTNAKWQSWPSHPFMPTIISEQQYAYINWTKKTITSNALSFGYPVVHTDTMDYGIFHRHHKGR